MGVKQVIIMRRRFPTKDGKYLSPRKGKLVAQGAHASCAFLMDLVRNPRELKSAEDEWIHGHKWRKVTLYVDNVDELIKVYEKAKLKGLQAHIIKDSGLTEFHGKDTWTAVCRCN